MTGSVQCTILYVDDETTLLDLGKLFLERDGLCRVTTAESALQALQLLQETSFDAIISDYEMPELNGVGFLKKVRESGSNIPFIIFTGRGREEVVIDAINNGVDFYLQKGGDPKSQFAELSAKVRYAINERSVSRELKESEKKLADILNFIPDVMLAIDLHGNIIAWNRAAEELTGVPASEILGKGNYESSIPFYGYPRPLLVHLLFHPADNWESLYKTTWREGEILVGESEAISINGKEIIIWGRAGPLYNDDGELYGAIEIIRDITDLKKKEKELSSAYEQLSATETQLRRQYEALSLREGEVSDREERYRRLLEVSFDAIIVLKEGTIISANSAATQALGFISEKDLIGKDFFSLIFPANREEINGLLGRLSRSEVGIVPPREEQFLLRNEKYLPVEMAATKYSDQENPAIFVIFRDISERIDRENKLHDAYERIAGSEEELRQQLYELNQKNLEILDLNRKLSESEEHLRLKLDSLLSPEVDFSLPDTEEFIDIPRLQALMDDFSSILDIPLAILDMNAKVLVASGWQDICTKFHRVCPLSAENCYQSDTILTEGVRKGELLAYQCKNHLWDAVTPLYVGEHHIANIFFGQFFYEDNVPDISIFREQGERYGYDLDKYLEAFTRVPVISRERGEKIMHLILHLTQQIADISYRNLKLARVLLEMKDVEEDLKLCREELSGKL